MTERLYYDNVYMKEFDAEVTACDKCDRGWDVRLDRSAFYPTSGGQPYDKGTLGGAGIVDVYVTPEGDVAHITDSPVNVGDTVHCVIDWARRFDHMQQHAGEHMLANACYRLLGGSVNGLHLGAEVSTIDVLLPDGIMRVSDDMLARLEDDVNTLIQRDVPIRQWFPTDEELASLPLRKPPTVSTHIRIVNIGELEYCACGGTHPSSAGQIGMLKIVDARPSRGRMRLTFKCGMRAFKDYRDRMRVIDAAAEKLSCGWEKLDSAVEDLKTARHELEHELAEAKKRAAARKLYELETVMINGVSVRAGSVGEAGPASLKDIAADALKADGGVLLLESECDGGHPLVFAAAEGTGVNAGALLTRAAKEFAGKGGGRPDFAQGRAAGAGAALYALRLLTEGKV